MDTKENRDVSTIDKPNKFILAPIDRKTVKDKIITKKGINGQYAGTYGYSKIWSQYSLWKSKEGVICLSH